VNPACLACGAELPPAGPAGGQRRLYCGHACRQAAWRRRRAARAALPRADELDSLIGYCFVQTDPIDGAAEVILTLKATARRARRLALETPPQLTWRLERTAQALEAALRELWPLDD